MFFVYEIVGLKTTKLTVALSVLLCFYIINAWIVGGLGNYCYFCGMKKIIMTLCSVMMLCASCGSLQQTAVLDEIRKIDNVSTYHVPVSPLGTLLNLGTKAANVPGFDLTALKNVKSIDVIAVNRQSGALNKVHGLLEQFYKGKTYELIFQAKENQRKNVSIYGILLSSGEYSNIIVINETDNEISILELKGTLSLDDLKLFDKL